MKSRCAASHSVLRVRVGAIAILFFFSVLLLTIPSIYASSTNQSSPTQTPPVNLSNDSINATNPAVASSGSHVYVAWSEGAGGIKFRSSPDNGTTWDPPILPVVLPATTISNQTAPNGAVQFPVMIANNSDVFIAWSQVYGKIGLQIFEATSVDYGLTFNVTQLTDTNGISSTTKGGYITPAIAASGSNVYVTFSGNGSKSYVMSSNNLGATWKHPFLYTTSLEDQVAAYGTSAYAIADHAVYATNNDGSSWHVVLGSKQFHGDEPMVAMYGNDVYVVTELPNGTNRADTYIRVYYSNDAQALKPKVNQVKDLSPAQNDSWAPMVGAYGSSAWVAFRTYPGGAKGTIWEYTTNNNGATWTPAGNALSGYGPKFNAKGTAETFPYEVASSDGTNVFVGWSHEVKSGVWTFMVSASNNSGTTWSAPPGVNLSQNTKGKAGFEIDLANGAISSTGPNCFAAWQYSLGKTNQVYFASLLN